MKPIIVDMKDMSDSKEVYESRPNPLMTYFIYFILLILIIAFVWMYIGKLDVVVKCSGMFQQENESYDISSSVSGKINKVNIEEGAYVTRGDILITVDNSLLKKELKNTKKNLADIKERLAILDAYEEYLDGDNNAVEMFYTNQYYMEFLNKIASLQNQITTNNGDSNGKKKVYQINIENTKGTIKKYEEKINQLNKVKNCITKRKNLFQNNTKQLYYYSMVENYLSSYNSTETEYNQQIFSCENDIISLEKQISTEEDFAEEIAKLKENRNVLKMQKKEALVSLKSQNLLNVTQEIETTKEAIETLQSDIKTAKAEMSMLSQGNKTKKSVIISEKSAVAGEKLTYVEKKKECVNAIRSYENQIQECKIVANTSGYISLKEDLKNGSTIQEGTTICEIIPEEAQGYYAEIYIENEDIAKIKVGQAVNMEVGAYPSAEYGYFTGTIDMISKDIKVDETSGQPYYLVRVKCEKDNIINGKGEKGFLLNGMVCQAKIVVENKSVLKYLLEKLDFVD